VALFGNPSTLPADIQVAGNTGAFTFEVTGNDEIEPTGTYYTVTISDANGDVVQINAYQFLGSGAYDLNLIDPFDPTLPLPPLPPLIINQLQTVAPSFDMVFDGDIGYTAFQTTLPGPVSAPVFQNMVPGNLYTFIIIQDAAGGHEFVWAANVFNAMGIDSQPKSQSVQTFVADGNGNLIAIGGGTYYP
jgi:hypothetical protein